MATRFLKRLGQIKRTAYTSYYIKQPKIVEVSPRDGLQNVSNYIPYQSKKLLISKLINAGIKNIEATSFVSKKLVPQMSDSKDIMIYCNNLQRKFPDVNFSALTPNMLGYNKACKYGVANIAIFTAASETFCKKNIGCTIESSLERYGEICLKAKSDTVKRTIRGYVSCIAGCPYEGDIDVERVVEVSKSLIDMGCDEVSLGDTIGVGTPTQISTILDSVLEYIPNNNIAVHFHDTYGNALDNIEIALSKDIMTIDSSVGGLGGCPFAKGAPGNVATEDVVKLLYSKGYTTGIDWNKLIDACKYAKSLLN